MLEMVNFPNYRIKTMYNCATMGKCCEIFIKFISYQKKKSRDKITQSNSHSAMLGKQKNMCWKQRPQWFGSLQQPHGDHVINQNVIRVTSLSLFLASKHVVIALMKWSHGSCQADKQSKITTMNANTCMLWKVEFHKSDHGTRSCMPCQTWDRCQNKERSGPHRAWKL